MSLCTRPRNGLLALLSLVLLGIAAAVPAQGFDVEQVRTRLEDGTFLMDADIRYELSARALEALENGVPLTVQLHIQVRPEDDWIWEASLMDQRLRYRIRYRPLSERYLVSQLPGEQGRTYVTRDAALAALGEIRDLPLVSQDSLDPDGVYEVQVRVSLDIEELPLPLRPMAYLYPSWKQASKWTKWPLTP